MKVKTHLLSLIRSPIKTGLTFLLLTVASFLFLYNLAEYSTSLGEYNEAKGYYEGVLTVGANGATNRKGFADRFLTTDPTNPGRVFERFSYEDWHQENLELDTVESLSGLAHISRVEKRYMTAGVSSEYLRLDSDQKFFSYAARCILVATIEQCEDFFYGTGSYPGLAKDGFKCLKIRDVELLAGNPAWVEDFRDFSILMLLVDDEYRDQYVNLFWNDYPSRNAMSSVDPQLFPEDYEQLKPGNRYVFVLRNIATQGFDADGHTEGDYGPIHSFVFGDDSIINWWPCITDVTDLSDGWLETDDFAFLRELIEVTNNDLHTFDVVYGDDMASIRRVAEGRIVCDDGRFITFSDSGQPVCVVNVDVLASYGLSVGDTITLDLGNYLCEQYAPLGAVASNRKRHATEFTRQTFTIIGAWSDLNEGEHVERDLYWSYSNNAIFVPSAFLPSSADLSAHAFKPGEISFVIENAEEILPFMEDELPKIEANTIDLEFSDGGWTNVAEDLMRARELALVKLLIFSGAAVFALVLTVWLFIGRKKREYGILRALGMPQDKAAGRLFIPFLLLGLVSVVFGLLTSWVVIARHLTLSEASTLGLICMGALGFLALLALIAFGGILLISRKSILTLTQEVRK